MLAKGRLFEPDALMPDQFFSGARRAASLQPEYLLAVAVLENAIETFQKYENATRRKQRVLFADAAAWIDSEDRSWPFSFINICELLGLDPDYVRNGLHGWRRKRQCTRRRAAPAEVG